MNATTQRPSVFWGLTELVAIFALASIPASLLVFFVLGRQGFMELGRWLVDHPFVTIGAYVLGLALAIRAGDPHATSAANAATFFRVLFGVALAFLGLASLPTLFPAAAPYAPTVLGCLLWFLGPILGLFTNFWRGPRSRSSRRKPAITAGAAVLLVAALAAAACSAPPTDLEALSLTKVVAKYDLAYWRAATAKDPALFAAAAARCANATPAFVNCGPILDLQRERTAAWINSVTPPPPGYDPNPAGYQAVPSGFGGTPPPGFAPPTAAPR